MEFIANSYNEKLSVSLNIKNSSSDLLILCHGTLSSKNSPLICYLDTHLKVNTLKFDFSGNGDSEGEFNIGGFDKEVDDIHSVVEHCRNSGYNIVGIVGHSKAGNTVLLYSNKYNDVPFIITLAARYNMAILPKILLKYEQAAYDEGFTFANMRGKSYRITREGLEERRNMNMAEVLGRVMIDVLVIHGESDDITSYQDSLEIASQLGERLRERVLIPNCDHNFNNCWGDVVESIEKVLYRGIS
jgi:alpha/beta superfamily hydrolase